MMKKLIVGLSVALMAANTAAAEDAPPPKAPTGAVYSGPCVSPALNADTKAEKGDGKEAGFLSGLLVSVGSAVIGKAFDWVGAQLTRLAESERTDVFGHRTSEAKFGAAYCIQVVRFASTGPKLLDLASRLDQWGAITTRKTPSVPLDANVDFFAEYWVRPSRNGGAVAFTPTLLYYPKLLAKADGSNKAAYLVKASVSVGGASASATWPLPASTRPDSALQSFLPAARPDGGKVYSQSLEALADYCESACDAASPWLENPWKTALIEKQAPSNTPAPAGKGGETVAAAKADAPPPKTTAKPSPKPAPAPTPAPAAAPTPTPALAAGLPGGGSAKAAKPPEYAVVPTNVDFMWTEVRDGSKFWKSVADFWNAHKADAQSEVEKAVFDQKRDEAKVAAMTASSTALSAFATKLEEAEANRVNVYCAAQTAQRPNWTSLSATLRAKQLAANVAASSTDQPMPFGEPIAVSSSFDQTVCPSS